MSFIVRLITPKSTDRFDGHYLSWRRHRNAGWTKDAAKAQRFDTQEAAFKCWKALSKYGKPPGIVRVEEVP